LVALVEGDPRVSGGVDQSHSLGFNFSLIYLLPSNREGTHFFKDHFAHTRPAEPWLGYQTVAYDVDPDIDTIPPDQFRSLVFWGAHILDPSSPQDVLDRVGKIHPVMIVGLDLRRQKVVGVVNLKELDPSADPLRGSRMPMF
jgi:hypothetical protein